MSLVEGSTVPEPWRDSADPENMALAAGRPAPGRGASGEGVSRNGVSSLGAGVGGGAMGVGGPDTTVPAGPLVGGIGAAAGVLGNAGRSDTTLTTVADDGV